MIMNWLPLELSLRKALAVSYTHLSSLTSKEIDTLFRLINKLRSEGVSIIYISHRMQELLEIGDRVTVMRDGAYIGTRNIKDIDMQELIVMMVGRKIENAYPRNYKMCIRDSPDPPGHGAPDHGPPWGPSWRRLL